MLLFMCGTAWWKGLRRSSYVSCVLFGCLYALLSCKLIHLHLVSLAIRGFINLKLDTYAL
jgi:hypothetical protein